jgi:hypothetical protein
MVDDEKLRIIAFEDRWHFVAILCCKAQGILNSDPKLARRKVAVKLGLSFGELDEVARRLAEVGLIDQKTLEPLAWDKRQFVSDRDSSARDRQRRRRERLKESKDSGVVTDVSRVTSPLRHGRVTRPEADTEADTYTETEERERDTPPATRSAPAPSADLIVRDPAEPTETKRSRKAVEQNARGTRLPADWVLSAELGNWAMAEGLTREQVIREAETFRDYWVSKPGAGGRKSDWDATWRNWVRKSGEYRNRGGNHAEQGEHITHAERVRRQAIQRLDELDRIEQMERGDRALGCGVVPPTDDPVPQPF